jgi:flagellar assembly factor FliW
MLSNQHGPTGLNSDPAITFPEGLVGCPNWKRFVLLMDEDEDLPVAILRSLDDPQVELLVTDPTLVEPDYVTRLKSLHSLGTSNPTVYCTLAVAADGSITANLMGPLVINPQSRVGHQLVLADSGYSTRHPIVQLTIVPGTN